MHADTSADTLLAIIATLMAELHPHAASSQQEITLDSALDRDLGLDSLSRMELLARLEKAYDLRLPEKVLTTAQTPRDLLRHLHHPALGASATSGQRETPPVSPAGARRHRARLDQVETLTEVLNEQATVQPDQEHILLLFGDREVRISYGELQRRALMVAARLRELDLEPGDTVAIMLPTCAEYFFCFFGILCAGGIPVPLYPPARPTQIEEHVRRHRGILANAGRENPHHHNRNPPGRQATEKSGSRAGENRHRRRSLPAPVWHRASAACPRAIPLFSSTPRGAPVIPKGWCSAMPTC